MLIDRSANPILLPPSGQLTRLQYFVTVCNRLKNTVACLLLYLVLILLNFVVIAWEYSGGSTRHWLAICLEAVINVILACEVATSILHLRRHYFQHWSNILDLTLTTLCLLFFIIFLTHPPPSSSNGGEGKEDTWETLDVTVLIVRYCFQLTRISVLIYRGRRTTDVLVQDDVDFTVHEMRAKMDVEMAAVESAHSGGTGGGLAGKKKGGTGSVAIDVDKHLEKQKLLERGSSRSSVSDVHELDQSLHDDERSRHDRALAGLEHELKRGDEHSDEEKRSRRSGQPVKRSASPSVSSRASVSQLTVTARARPLPISVSDNALHRQRVEQEEEDMLELSSSDEDESV